MTGNADHTEAVARPRNESGTDLTMGIPYDPPAWGAGAAEDVQLTRRGLVWRIVASLVLAAIGVNALVRMIPLLQSANTDPHGGAWVPALGLLVLAALFLAYPVLNLVRWVRSRR